MHQTRARTRKAIRRWSFMSMVIAVLMLAGSTATSLANGSTGLSASGSAIHATSDAAQPSAHAHDASAVRPTAGANRLLQRLRAVTFKYRDVDVALADGYTPITLKGALCYEHSEEGAMGIHYLNPNLVDGTLDPLQPELLIYFPDSRGRLRLVAVEYFTPDTGQPHPTLYDRPLNGPVTTFLPEIPVHYSLHAWVWFPNPAGVFASFNPALKCPWANPPETR